MLRIAWGNARVGDAELEPPNVQPTETVNACGGKRGAVVTADSIGKSMFTKQAQELALDPFSAHVRESVAAEQIAAEVIDEGQRVAVEPVAHEELPFEVDGPNLVGCGGAAPGCFQRRWRCRDRTRP